MVSKARRIWLSIFSPNVVILICLLFMLIVLFVAYMAMLYNSRDMVKIYEDSERLERITGVAFPEFKLMEYEKGEASFLGDYEDKFILEMEEERPEATYHHLDSIIECGDAHWDGDGESRLTLPAVSGKVELFDEFAGKQVAFEKSASAIVIPAGNRRYLKTPLSADEIKAAFAAAVEMNQ